MKRLIFAFAIVALALVSCNKFKKTETRMELPENKDFHASYVLTDQSFSTPVSSGEIPKTIDLTSGGKFLLGFIDTDASDPATAPLKYVSGEYQILSSKAPSANLIYFFPMYGTLTIKEGTGNNWIIDYTSAKGNSYNGAATLSNEVVSGSLANEICRSWKPTTIIVSASGGDMTAIVGKKFSADLDEIFAYLKEKGVKFNTGDYAQYQLESIDYTETGLFIVNFKDFAISPFVGNFSLQELSDENLEYNFNLSWVDNPVIPVSGKGAVTVTGNEMSLFTESDVVISNKTYHISATIISTEIKD